MRTTPAKNADYDEERTLERKVLPLFIEKCRSFSDNARAITKTTVSEAIPLRVERGTHFLLITKAYYAKKRLLPVLYAAYGKILLTRHQGDENPGTLQLDAEQWQHYVSRFCLACTGEQWVGVRDADHLGYTAAWNSMTLL